MTPKEKSTPIDAKPEIQALLKEVDAVGDELILKVEYSSNHRMSAALYERTTLILAKVGGFLSSLEASSTHSTKADVEALDTLKGIIVRKEQELNEDVHLPIEQFQHTSMAFLWVCKEIDKLSATINSKESRE